jgi:hypothetical protein
MKDNEATSIVKLDVTMDGNRDGEGYGNYCFGQFKDEAGKFIPAKKDKNTYYAVLKSPAGKVYLDNIFCNGYKVFYNKARTYNLKDFYFVAEAGKINYAGDLKGIWESDRLNAGDLFFSAGGLVSDDGTMELRLIDRYDEAKEYVKNNYPVEDPEFKRSLFKKHPLLTK